MKTHHNISRKNLYSVHDEEDKAIALILANDSHEARKIWQDKQNHDLTFIEPNQLEKVTIKELQKAFHIQKITRLLSEKNMNTGKSLLCTKLARYYKLVA